MPKKTASKMKAKAKSAKKKFCAFLLRFLRCHRAETAEQQSDEGVLYALLYERDRAAAPPLVHVVLRTAHPLRSPRVRDRT